MGYQVGGSLSGELIGVPAVLGKEVITVYMKEEEYKGISQTYGGSLSLMPAEIHAGPSQSQIWYNINIADQLEDWIWDTIPE